MKQHTDNYAILAQQVRDRFLTYDQAAIISNIPITHDPDYFYLNVLSRPCRISRSSGLIDWFSDDVWIPSTAHSDYLTVFDYLCDAKPDRFLTGKWTHTANFGHLFHTGLLETASPSSLESSIDRDPDRFCRACEALGGTPCGKGDIGFRLPLFPDFPVLLQFWHSDEEFPPQLRFYWDANALSYLRYETMYYAAGMIQALLRRDLSSK